jgi:hypothetical protein
MRKAGIRYLKNGKERALYAITSNINARYAYNAFSLVESSFISYASQLTQIWLLPV